MSRTELHTVLVPGLACSARLWDPLMPSAWARGGVTIADTRRDTSLTGIADRLLADAPATFALAGISMGGYICLEVMRRAPDRVRGLALISTSAAPDTSREIRSRTQQIELVRNGGFDELVGAAFPTLVAEENLDSTELARLWNTMAHEVGPDAFITQQKAVIERADTRPVLTAITCPTAIVHGVADRTIPVVNAEETADAIVGSSLTLVEHAGHMAAQERPAEVADAFAALLDRVVAVDPEA